MPGGDRIAIMQPYFLPYLGYWQLMNFVDTFVIYDDIQFTKKGWIHRNRYLNNGSDQMFTLPLKKDSDFLDVIERKIADSWGEERNKIRKKIEGAYRKAPHFEEGMMIFNECLDFDDRNLFEFIFHSIRVVKARLAIDTKLAVSSHIGFTNELKGQSRVVEICKLLGASEYVNPIGGQKIYSKHSFKEQGLDLKFHKIRDVQYDQNTEDFIPNLSLLDMLMFVGVEGTKKELSSFEIK
ncbi:WbqC family protein [Alloalcanivorax marinus]|uniref:WbqC family protein n=1 Tax=Alloalcanivorax marinus TaxID=1177169 RepID=UPI0021CF49C2|nr:WbqC family protein [Alloalcanivorax marinus]MCU5787478.1 hypothetical protein [Alloalcanivorax marinus]